VSPGVRGEVDDDEHAAVTASARASAERHAVVPNRFMVLALVDPSATHTPDPADLVARGHPPGRPNWSLG
jgi:hypothetical protein